MQGKFSSPIAYGRDWSLTMNTFLSHSSEPKDIRIFKSYHCRFIYGIPPNRTLNPGCKAAGIVDGDERWRSVQVTPAYGGVILSRLLVGAV
jgi:hypothetical protein